MPESLQHDLAVEEERQQHHLGVELADCKAKLRRLKQELDDKLDMVADLKIDLAKKDCLLATLRQEVK